MEKGWCPAMFVHNLIDREIEDPKVKSIEKVREIRDEIEVRIKDLIAKLASESGR